MEKFNNAFFNTTTSDTEGNDIITFIHRGETHSAIVNKNPSMAEIREFHGKNINVSVENGVVVHMEKAN